MEVEVKPASAEELDAFLGQNRRWIPDDAEKVLRGMSGLDQRRVISGGTMSSVQNPVAVIQARVRKAKELEAAVSRSGGKVPAVLMGLESKLIKPATAEDLDAFIKANDRWLGDEAVQTLRSMSAFDQRRVISAGTMSGCRDPVAVIQTRAKKAREMEMELENLAAGKGPLLKKEKPQAPAPSFDEEAAAMHLYAPPEEVLAWESRFAPPPIEDEDSALVGESPGVGGVVEILKAKYGCSKGQRIRVIGETHALLQFEGGKTAPKNHEDSGWKWVIREEEEVKQSAAQAQMAALKQAAAAQLAQVEAAKAAELARAQAEAKAYAAAQEEAMRSQEHAKPKQKEPKALQKARRSSSSCSSSSSETEEKKHRHQKNPKKGKDREKKARSAHAKKKKEAKSKAARRDALSKSRKTKKKKSEEKRKTKKAAKAKKRKARSSSSSGSATDVTIPGASEA